MDEKKQNLHPLVPDLTPLTPQERVKKLIPEIALFNFFRNPEDEKARNDMFKAAFGTSETEALLAPHKQPEKWADKEAAKKEEKKSFLSWLGF